MTATTSAISPPASSTQDLRMLTALLASCDPCDFVAGGASSKAYAGIAWHVLEGLRTGDDVSEILLRFPSDADAAAALRFARVAVDWWDNCLVAQRRTLGAAHGA